MLAMSRRKRDSSGLTGFDNLQVPGDFENNLNSEIQGNNKL